MKKRARGGAFGVTLRPGIFGQLGHDDAHVVGLQVDPGAAELAEGLRAIRDGRLERAARIAEGLAGVGLESTLEGALALAENKEMLSRTHFARHLVERGAVKDTQAAFDKYLGKGKPAFVPHQWAGLEEAIEWIRASGGVAAACPGLGSFVAPVFHQDLKVSALRSTPHRRLQAPRAHPLTLVNVGTSWAKLGNGLVMARDDDRAAGLGLGHRSRKLRRTPCS